MSTSHWKTFSPETKTIVQGMTGKEGLRMTKWLLQSGVKVCAGVTPGKGGMEVEGCPIFNSVQEAVAAFPDIEVTSIVVPASRTKSAVLEALASGLKYIHILTESIPVHDVLAFQAEAKKQGATVLGPSSIGYLQFPAFRMGYIGGENPFEHIREGGIGLVSTSGGMTNELMMALGRHDLGVRVAFAVGGDRVPGLSLEEAVKICDEFPGVERLVVFAEPGRPLLQKLLKDEVHFKHPLVIFLAGDILDDLPRGRAYGHTGTLLQEEGHGVAETRVLLKEKGITCVATSPELITHLQA